MSISQLFQPNSYNLCCNTLDCSSCVISTIDVKQINLKGDNTSLFSCKDDQDNYACFVDSTTLRTYIAAIDTEEIDASELSIGGVDTVDKVLVKDAGNSDVFRVDTLNNRVVVSNILATNKLESNSVVYTLPPSDGTNGQVLGTDGAGVTSWKSVSTGSHTAVSLATTGASVVIDASAPPTVNQVLKATSATNATWQNDAGGTLAGDVSGPIGANVIGASKVLNTMLAGSISDTKLSTISTTAKVSNSATTATNLNTANSIVSRDVNGDFITHIVNAENLNGSTGVLVGGVLSINADPTKFDISGGTGLITTDYQFGGTISESVHIEWTAFTAQTTDYLLTDLISYISIGSAGQVIQSATRPTHTESRDQIFLGVLVHVNKTILDNVNQEPLCLTHTTNQLADLFSVLGFMNISGNSILNKGVDLQIKKTSGTVLAFGSNFHIDSKNPHVKTIVPADPQLFQIRLSDGTNQTGLTQGLIEPDNWENPLGTYAAVGNNKFTIQRFYLFTSGNVKVQPGQTEYSSIQLALDSVFTETYTPEPSMAANGIWIAVLIVKKGCTDLSNLTEAVFQVIGRFGNVSGSTGSPTATLQSAYDNSVSNPEILTNATGGAVNIRGHGADANSILTVQNSVGTNMCSIDGFGRIYSGTVNVGSTDTSLTTVALNKHSAGEFSIVNYTEHVNVLIPPTKQFVVKDISLSTAPFIQSSNAGTLIYRDSTTTSTVLNIASDEGGVNSTQLQVLANGTIISPSATGELGTVTYPFAKLYTDNLIDDGTKVQATAALSVGNDNVITGVEGSLNIDGDMTLYNATKNTIVFADVGEAKPGLTTRTAGTKIVLAPTISGTTLDNAIGCASGSVWVSGSSQSIDFKFNNTDGSVLTTPFVVTGAGQMSVDRYSSVAGDTIANFKSDNTSGTGVGVKAAIYANGDIKNDTGVYGTLSDLRLKENILPARSYLDDLALLQVKSFNFKADELKLKQLGFIAQDVQTVFPRLVDVGVESVNDIEDPLSVKTSILIPILVKCVQELYAKNKVLESNTSVTNNTAMLNTLAGKISILEMQVAALTS